MSIQSFVEASKRLFQENYYHEALCLTCIAVDACAARDYPHIIEINERYKLFLKQHFRTITDFGFPGVSADSIKIKVSANVSSLKPDKDGYVDMVQIIYHTLRCGLAHNCDIEKTIIFTDRTIIGNWDIHSFYIPRTLIWGLISAIDESM